MVGGYQASLFGRYRQRAQPLADAWERSTWPSLVAAARTVPRLKVAAGDKGPYWEGTPMTNDDSKQRTPVNGCSAGRGRGGREERG